MNRIKKAISATIAAIVMCGVNLSYAAESNELEIIVQWGQPDYIAYPKGKTLSIPSTTGSIGKDPNLKSYLITYKGWNLIGDYCYSAGFYWELNPESLQGKTKTVYFNTLAQYPDLVERYKAIRPISVNFVVKPSFYDKAGQLRTMDFKVTDNDLVYFGSRSDQNYIVPTCAHRWKDAVSNWAKFGNNSKESDESLQKDIAAITEIIGRGDSSPVILSIKWPGDAIDEIDLLHKQYKSGKKKPPVSAEAAPSSNIQSAPEARTKAREKAWEEKKNAVMLKPNMVALPNLGIEMGKYEITQGQWRAVMGNNPSHFSQYGDNCPVEQVSWDDVQEYIKRLNERTGERYRLPTEQEWEAACLAGQHTEYCGSNNVDAVAWYTNNSGDKTRFVGENQANGWGLYDMSGNVWEWTADCFGNCGKRVFRGGSWNNRPQGVRSTNRGGGGAARRDSNIGFRLARTLP